MKGEILMMKSLVRVTSFIIENICPIKILCFNSHDLWICSIFESAFFCNWWEKGEGGRGEGIWTVLFVVR